MAAVGAAVGQVSALHGAHLLQLQLLGAAVLCKAADAADDSNR